MSERGADGGDARGPVGPREPRGGEGAAAERKWEFLRAVYPLNPGIPHYLDFPQDRE